MIELHFTIQLNIYGVRIRIIIILQQQQEQQQSYPQRGSCLVIIPYNAVWTKGSVRRRKKKRHTWVRYLGGLQKQGKEGKGEKGTCVVPMLYISGR